MGFNFKVIVVISYGVFCISLSMGQKVAAATAELQSGRNFRHLHSRAAEFLNQLHFIVAKVRD